ncbi:MAG: hypothetical protein ACI4SG_03795 [Oligosphaeraceae bacterium]
MPAHRLLLLLLLLLPAALPAQDTAAPPGDAPCPTPRQWLQTRKLRGATQGEAEEDELLSTETFFVHQEKQEKWTWGPRGSYKATIKIPRYFGSREQILTMARCGLMPAAATLILPAHDCDSGDEGKTTVMPEVDQVYLNGHYLGTLQGETDHVDFNLLSVPLEWIQFPGSPGEVAENHLEILVDTANDEPIWVLGQFWQALLVPAPSPVLLVHGWTDIQDMLSSFAAQLSRTLGVPSYLAFVPQFSSPELNAFMLQAQLENLTRGWGVRKFHVVGHSKGGLDARVLVDAAGVASPLVKSVLQISTPNLGSRVADVISYPSGVMEQSFSVLADWVADARRSSPGFRSLRTEDCLRFNQSYHAPVTPLHTIMGMVKTENLPATYKSLVKIANLPTPNDGIVTVASAHALHTQVPESPLDSRDTSLYDHSSIVRDGAGDVLPILHRFLQEEVDELLQILPRTPRTRGGDGMPAEGDGEDSVPVWSWTFPLSGDAPMVRPLPLGAGAFSLMILSAPQGTQAEIRLPGEENARPLTILPADETLLMEGSPLWGEFTCDVPGDAHLTLRPPGQAVPRLATLLLRGTLTRPPRELLLENLTPALSPPPGELLLQAQCPGGDEEADPVSLTWQAHSLDRPGEELPQEWLRTWQEGAIHKAQFAPTAPGTWEITVTGRGDEGEEAGEFLTASLVVQTYGGSVRLATPLQETLEELPEGGKDLLWETEVTVSQGGRYALTGTLATQEGEILLLRGDQWQAQEGVPRLCRLRFPEEALPKPVGDSPWLLARLQLIFLGDGEETATPIPLNTWEVNQPVSPAAQEYYRSLTWGAILPGTGLDRLLSSGDIQGARLEITLDLLPLVPPRGDTMPAATLPLYAPSGQFLGQATANPRRTEEGAWQVTVAYPRQTLLHAQEDGPYLIRNGFLSRTNDQEEEEIAPLQGTYTTAPYSRLLFHDASLLDAFSPSESLLPGEESEGEEGPALRLRFSRPSLLSSPAPAPSPAEEFLLFSPFGDSTPPFLSPRGFSQEGMTGFVQDITQEVRQLLPTLGNGDALLDEGETLELLLPLARPLEEGEENRLVLLILTREDSHAFLRSRQVLHPLDSNRNLALSPQEVEQGRKQWKAGGISSEILLNGLYLREYSYQYEPARKRHVRSP